MVAQHTGDSLQFGDVARGGRGTVDIHIINIFGFDAGVLDGVAHRLHGTLPFGMRGGEVVSVGRSAAADDLAVDLGTAGLGMFILLEDQGSGAFADHETVAILVERTRSVLGIVVARGERLHGVEPADTRLVDRSFGASGHHHVGLPVADGVERGDHAVVRRCARRHRAVVGPHEAVLHGDETGCDVGDHAGNKERAKPRGSIPCGPAQTLIEERFDSSDARTPDHPHLFLVDGLEVERRILDGLRGRDQGILGEKVVLAYFLTVEIEVRVVILYFTSKLRLKLLCIEMSNRCGTADSLLQIRKILFNIITERVDRTDARNNYSSFCHKFKAIRGCECSFYKLFLVLFDILDSVANGSDLLSVLVRNLDIESLLEFHAQLHGVERVCTQVVGKACFGYNLRFLDTQFVDDDLDNF